MLASLAHFIERHPTLHRAMLRVWKHFPARLAGMMKVVLTTKWTVGAVAVIIDEDVSPPEVLFVQHSYRTKGVWGLPGGALESNLASPLSPRHEENVLESTLRREVFEELGIEIEIERLITIDALPYVPEEPGPYRLDFYYKCRPASGLRALRDGIVSGSIKARSPEICTMRFVPLTKTHEYDVYSSDAKLLSEHFSGVTQFV